MLSKNIKRTLLLLKKSSKQPIIFQKLYNHLGWLCKNETKNINYQNLEDWSMILICGAMKEKIITKNFDKLILQFLKENRESSCNEIQFRIKIMLCYLNNQDIKLLNNFIFFELIYYHFGFDNLNDYLIVKICNQIIVSEYFGLIYKNKIQNCLEIFYKKIMDGNYQVPMKCLLLPVFVKCKELPISFKEISIDDPFIIRIIESFCFFAKYSENTSLIREIAPEGDKFIDLLQKYINKEIQDIEPLMYVSSNLFVKLERFDIFKTIKRFYDDSEKKIDLKQKLIDFCNELN